MGDDNGTETCVSAENHAEKQNAENHTEKLKIINNENYNKNKNLLL